MGENYSFRVEWSAEDSEYVGLCNEFPSLSWLAPTSEAALAGIEMLVTEVLQDLRESGDAY